MTTPSHSCFVHHCKTPSHTVCIHCNHYFCGDHLNEHKHKSSEKVAHLSDTIDKLAVRLSSVEPSCLEQLDQWRQAAYQSVDGYCKKKRHDLIEKRRDHQKKELDHLRHKFDQLIGKQDLTQDQFDSINHNIQLEEIQLNELEHLRLSFCPLMIDESLIVQRHLFPLSHPNRTIHLKTGIESSVGTNEKHLLVDREGKHLCLLDRNLTLLNEIPFTHDGIHSICWSATIARFIIITFKEIFILDEKTMKLDKCSISSDVDWWRGTCSDEILFLSTVEWGSSISEFNVRSSFEFVKEWHTPVTCGKQEIICDLKYKNGFLAVPIFNKHRDDSRLDLRSATTLDCIWSVRIHGRCRCCSIDGDQWLVMDHDDCRFFHISADGRLLKTHKYDEHDRLEDIIPWGDNDIIVLTKKNVHLHQL